MHTGSSKEKINVKADHRNQEEYISQVEKRQMRVCCREIYEVLKLNIGRKPENMG